MSKHWMTVRRAGEKRLDRVSCFDKRVSILDCPYCPLIPARLDTAVVKQAFRPTTGHEWNRGLSPIIRPEGW
jgi:hypothetical protein